MQTRLYRQQHAEIRRLLDEADRSLVDAEACRSVLARLAGVLNIHLAMEDRALYPRMMTHDDPLVRETAMAYRQGMGQLGTAFEAFCRKWGAHGAIEVSPDHFSRAQRVMAQALKQRMDMEDGNLFELVDGGTPAPAS